MTPSPNIVLVIIGDNTGYLDLLSTAVARAGLTIHTASGPDEGLKLVFREHPQVVLADFPDPEIPARIAGFDPSIDVILLSAKYTPESAVEAIRKGAADYLSKPISFAALSERVHRLVDAAQRRQRASAIENALLNAARFENMIGHAPVMAEMFSRIRRIAPHFRAALINGEPGAGKEVAARALHNLSPVSAGRFAILRCPDVVPSLLEAELAGHLRNASGAVFLDEVGALPLPTQALLLQSLERTRVIAATSTDLRIAVARRLFREDLYRALSTLEIHVPRLADRPEDLPLLIRAFLAQSGKPIRGLTQRARTVLARHSFSGNVRELEAAIQHACTVARTGLIDARDLPEHMHRKEAPASEPHTAETLEDHERHVIAEALSRAGGNQSQAAKDLEIGRDALRYKMRRHGLLRTQRPASR